MRWQIETFVIKQVVAIIPSGESGFIAAVFEMLPESGSQVVGYPDIGGGAGMICGYINEVVAIEHNAARPKIWLYKFTWLRS